MNLSQSLLAIVAAFTRRYHPDILGSGARWVALSQLRLRRGHITASDSQMQLLQSAVGLVHGVESTDIRDGVGLGAIWSR